jgi:lipocalin
VKRSVHARRLVAPRSPLAEGKLDGAHVDTYQRAYIHNHETFTEMRITPKLPVVGYTPLRLPYIITHMADDYSHVIVGYPSREYLWIMARSPTLPPAQYDMLVAISKAQGYNTELIRKVPQDPTRPVFQIPALALP